MDQDRKLILLMFMFALLTFGMGIWIGSKNGYRVGQDNLCSKQCPVDMTHDVQNGECFCQENIPVLNLR